MIDNSAYEKYILPPNTLKLYDSIYDGKKVIQTWNGRILVLKKEKEEENKNNVFQEYYFAKKNFLLKEAIEEGQEWNIKDYIVHLENNFKKQKIDIVVETVRKDGVK